MDRPRHGQEFVIKRRVRAYKNIINRSKSIAMVAVALIFLYLCRSTVVLVVKESILAYEFLGNLINDKVIVFIVPKNPEMTKMEIFGLNRLTNEDITNALENSRVQNNFALNTIRQALQKISIIDNVTVRYDIVHRKIVVYITEKELIGVLVEESFRKEKAIDLKGNIVNIEDYDDRTEDLIGVKNVYNIKDFILLYSYLHHTGIDVITDTATLISNRRWDLRFRNGLLVKLPAENWHRAIDVLMYINTKLHVLDSSNEVVYIDLRIENKIFLR